MSNTHNDPIGKHILVIGILAVVLGLGLILWLKPQELLWKIVIGGVTELGFAAIIAWVVAFMLEKGARDDYDRYTQEKAKDISKNVFSYLYGVRLPRRAFDAIEEYIFREKVIKTEQKLNYHLLQNETNVRNVMG